MRLGCDILIAQKLDDDILYEYNRILKRGTSDGMSHGKHDTPPYVLIDPGATDD